MDRDAWEPTEVLRVSLGERSYDIVIAGDLLPRIGQWIDRDDGAAGGSHVVVIVDERLASTYGRIVSESLSAERRCDVIEVPSGESSKSVSQADRLWNKLLDLHTDRRSIVVAVGGGVVGDLAGFVAGTFARGIRFVQVPTTLLAQVDSSVGGKTGVNLARAKNMVGVFWQPDRVLIDPSTLESLPEREYRSGLAEVVKYGMILDADFFSYLERRREDILAQERDSVTRVIHESCRLKAEIVAQDERETGGVRAILNYGHTFAHAFEAVTQYGVLLHGEAVSIGMVCAADLAVRLGMLSADIAERQQRLLEAFGLPVRLDHPVDASRILEAMRHDKKCASGALRFVLPERIGEVRVVPDVPLSEIASVVEPILP